MSAILAALLPLWRALKPVAPWLAALVALVGVALAINHTAYKRGRADCRAEWQAATAKAEATARAKEAGDKVRVDDAQQAHEERQQAAQIEYRTVEKEVVRYVERKPETVAAVCLDADARSLLDRAIGAANAAATGDAARAGD